jgi:hypothetical protein
MADLEDRVSELEKKVNKLELDINTSLSDIKIDLTEIKTALKSSDNAEELKNEVIKKDVDSNTKRIEKLENNQSKLVWTLIGEIVAIISSIVIAVIKLI